MARYSQEKLELIRTQIRRILVKRQFTSARQIAKAMGMTEEFVGKMIKKIEKERKYNMNYQLLNVELAKAEEHFTEIIEYCWGVIQNTERERLEYFGKKPTIGEDGKPIPQRIEYGEYIVSHREKVAAAREIRMSFESLFKIKFDAGIFERKLGELELKLPIAEIVMKVNQLTGVNKFNWQSNKGLPDYKPDVEKRPVELLKSGNGSGEGGEGNWNASAGQK